MARTIFSEELYERNTFKFNSKKNSSYDKENHKKKEQHKERREQRQKRSKIEF